MDMNSFGAITLADVWSGTVILIYIYIWFVIIKLREHVFEILSSSRCLSINVCDYMKQKYG